MTAAAVGVRVGKVINYYKVAKHLVTTFLHVKAAPGR